jgi:hypothetical protein
MTSLDGSAQLFHQEEGMSEQQKRLIKKMPLLGEPELIWRSVTGPIGISGGSSDVLVGE